MQRNMLIAAALVAVLLLLAFFIWPETPGEITEETPGDVIQQPGPVEDPAQPMPGLETD